MLKKIIFILLFSFLSIGTFITETKAAETAETTKTEKKGFSLTEALEISQNSKEKNTPVVLPKSMPGVSQKEETKTADFTQILRNIINGLTGISAGIAVLFIIINASTLIFAVGNSDKISNAKKGLTWAAIGLVLIIFAYIIAKTIILLTYSGEEFDTNPAAETPAIEEPETDPVCETEINKAENSCYEILEGQTKQSRKAGACAMESNSVQSKICESMKKAEKMNKETTCTLQNIQTALKDGGFYSQENINKGWAEADGKYGLATEDAMIKYYESRNCQEKSASAINSSKTKNTKNEESAKKKDVYNENEKLRTKCIEDENSIWYNNKKTCLSKSEAIKLAQEGADALGKLNKTIIDDISNESSYNKVSCTNGAEKNTFKCLACTLEALGKKCAEKYSREFKRSLNEYIEVISSEPLHTEENQAGISYKDNDVLAFIQKNPKYYDEASIIKILNNLGYKVNKCSKIPNSSNISFIGMKKGDAGFTTNSYSYKVQLDFGEVHCYAE